MKMGRSWAFQQVDHGTPVASTPTVFSNLAYEDPDFDFKKILQAADPDAAEDLEEIIGPHVEELLRQFTRYSEADAPTTGSGQTTV